MVMPPLGKLLGTPTKDLTVRWRRNNTGFKLLLPRPQKRRHILLAIAMPFLWRAVVRADTKEVVPAAGLRIQEDAQIASGTYLLPDPEDDGSLVIEGNDLTVDFGGATLRGAPEGAPPDQLTGRGLVIRGEKVTVKNARVHGYKVGIFAEGSKKLTLENCDVSRNYRQRLKSTPETEDLSDWLYGHENDNNEWLRYGAGIYLFNCEHATVRACRARNGQNGLCLVRCDHASVVDNDLSFMSGWGLALWRSSHCDVYSNKFDWCIRGYSHGVYSRGQDSAGILVYEQCSQNTFAYNSATHGGDGFFLYAGNETVHKTGEGGCNNNLLYKNDFSHAAANGIEATFSKANQFVQNTLDECEHGVWAGYSSSTLVAQNTIRHCRNGVSIEHGRDNKMMANTIEDTPVGIHFWWDDDKDLLASAFGKKNRGCPSVMVLISGNVFRRVGTAIWLIETTMGRIGDNSYTEVETPLHVKGAGEHGFHVCLPESEQGKVKTEGGAKIVLTQDCLPARDPSSQMGRPDREGTKKGSQETVLPPGARRGRKHIFVDEWGPYDFSDVRLFPGQVAGGSKATLQLVSPVESTFRVMTTTGDVIVVPMTGTSPNKLTVAAQRDGVHEFAIDVDANGQRLRAEGTLFRADWAVAFYRWASDDDPRGGEEAWKRITSTEPADTLRTTSVDFVWGNKPPTANVPPDHFATVATARLELPAGDWRIRTVSDDGVRVILDGKEVLANWTHHGPTPNEVTTRVEGGMHEIRLEHFEIDGYAQLQFRLDKNK